jgi:hypothetical protein
MKHADREARLQRAKAAGRIAYRLARDATIGGFIEIEGERKFTRDFRRGPMSIELYEAAGRPICDTDFSQLRVHFAGRKVFVIRWSVAGNFKIVLFEPGDWERTLCAWPAPIASE